MQQSGRTRFLILGLLAEGPCSGYDIRRITAARFRFFWSESFGQIYPCLKRMETEGLIAGGRGAGRSKVLWSITGTGRNALRSWLREEAQPETARMETILKYYFSREMPAGSRERLLEAFHQRQERNLAELENFRRQLRSIPDPHANHDLAQDTIELGMATYQAWSDWAAARLARAPGRRRRPTPVAGSARSARGTRSHQPLPAGPRRRVRSGPGE